MPIPTPYATISATDALAKLPRYLGWLRRRPLQWVRTRRDDETS